MSGPDGSGADPGSTASETSFLISVMSQDIEHTSNLNEAPAVCCSCATRRCSNGTRWGYSEEAFRFCGAREAHTHDQDRHPNGFSQLSLPQINKLQPFR